MFNRVFRKGLHLEGALTALFQSELLSAFMRCVYLACADMNM